MSNSAPNEVSFTHVVLEGSPYEVGRQQGEMLANDLDCAKHLTPPLPFLDKFSQREANNALEYFDKYCPGLGDEIQGAADAFGIPVEEIAFLGGKNKETGSSPIPLGKQISHNSQVKTSSYCSHFAILPSASQDGHLYVGRNQDDSPDSLDLRLCTTRVRGKASHIGFSDMIFGRIEGMNEHGLCVTTSLGAPGVWMEGEGLPYFAVVRTILDRCKTVAEALEVIAGLPIAWCTNIIVADQGGEAALIEVAYTHRNVKRIGRESQSLFICATNHYTLPGMKPYDTARRRESVQRRRTILSRLTNSIPHLDKGAIRAILSELIPKGLCMHHYSSGLGTLWSVIFDATDTTVEICFGSPNSDGNPWHSFDLQGPAGVTQYKAHFPDEAVPSGFWERLPPGCDG